MCLGIACGLPVDAGGSRHLDPSVTGAYCSRAPPVRLPTLQLDAPPPPDLPLTSVMILCLYINPSHPLTSPLLLM